MIKTCTGGLFLILLLYNGDCSAQVDPLDLEIDIKFNETTLDEALNRIESVSGISFTYS